MKKLHPVSSRNRFNWRLWFALGAVTELFLIYVARWWAPSPVTYFLAVLFLPVMVLTGFWSFKYFRVVQLNLELSRACVPHVFRVYSGGHEQKLWQQYATPWLSMALAHLTPAQ